MSSILPSQQGVENFFRFARHRHLIHLNRKAGQPAPWTDDPILQNNRFCNVFRELDKTTVWFRENIRSRLSDPAELILATVIFRWFNKIETGEVLKTLRFKRDHNGWPFLDIEGAREAIHTARAPGPYVTGAYIIKTPDGKNKLDGLLWCIDQFQTWNLQPAVASLKHNSLEKTWEALCQAPYLGAFMSYEVVTDLRHTPLLNNAHDIFRWANPGPGCARGLDLVAGQPVGTFNRASPKDRATMMLMMQELVKIAPYQWPWNNVWEMRDVEHTCCETDKYHRALEGGRMKQRFNGAG